MTYTSHYDSAIGRITLASNGEALTGLWFDGQKHFASTISGDHETNEDLPIFQETRNWLDIYFSGQAPHFTPPICINGSEFRKQVWKILLTIPFGQTMSYGAIAQLMACQKGTNKMSARAIGGAVGHNPISLIIPCHRVVGANGQLTGYAGGKYKKLWLLQNEHVPTVNFHL